MAKINFTTGRVAGFRCPGDKAQAFLWDSGAPGLGIRATPRGRPTFVFQAVYGGKDVRLTIGDPDAWSLPDARNKARVLQREIDEGRDPRNVKKDAVAEQAAREAAVAAMAQAAELQATKVEAAWGEYVEARRPHWGETHYKDHIKLARAGGEVARRGTRGRGTTIDMPLRALMSYRLAELDSVTVEAWAAQEATTRPTSARLAWRLLKVFLNWCAEHPKYADIVATKNAAATKKAREALGKAKVKTDALMREQLPHWFKAVRAIGNPTIAAALQTMLLVGARPNEVLSMRWEDVDMKWKRLTIRDKVEGERDIPLTPYVAGLLSALPRSNDWVFASTRTVLMDDQNILRRSRRAAVNGGAASPDEVIQASESGHITEPRSQHSAACDAAGIKKLTLHGLRRSFKSLTEWLETPAGVVAQIMGHKPSATAEKHYTVRPLDLLRVHHERIEAWILKEAAITETVSAEQLSASAVLHVAG